MDQKTFIPKPVERPISSLMWAAMVSKLGLLPATEKVIGGGVARAEARLTAKQTANESLPKQERAPTRQVRRAVQRATDKKIMEKRRERARKVSWAERAAILGGTA